MIISRKRFEAEMAQRKAEIDLLDHQMTKMCGEICRLQDDVIGMRIRLEQFEQKDGRAEAEQENCAIPILCKNCIHAIDTLDGRLMCLHDNLEHDPYSSCSEWAR